MKACDFPSRYWHVISAPIQVRGELRVVIRERILNHILDLNLGVSGPLSNAPTTPEVETRVRSSDLPD